MPDKDEPFANPAAPPGAAQHVNVEATPARLTNADFRKLLMTPRAGPAGASSATPAATPAAARPEIPGKIDKAEERRKKKSYYAKLKRAEDDIMAELAKKYRDRAKERRDGDETPAGGGPVQPAADFPTQPDDANVTASAYRAVAPDLKSGLDAAERRRQQIQESKFLGGDMEHTHLVKGLDYALLQKVRSEIQAMELEHEDEMEQLVDGAETKKKEEVKEEEVHFKTKMGKSIYRVLFRDKPPQRNDLFLPGRTAYRIDLDEEFVDFDIPTTVVRSKADCPQVETATTLTTNDIVINKLTQILSYLRQGRHGRRLKKKDKQRANAGEEKKVASEDIYGDLGDYVPAPTKKDRERERDRDRDADKSRSDGDRQRKPRSYFDRPEDESRRDRDKRHERERREKEREREREEQEQRDKEQAERDKRDKERFEQEKGRESNWLAVDAAAAAKRSKDMGTALSGYAECYPGLEEMADAIDDSDDEADYSKMDMGNKKGPIGRWDFDTQEEYSNYMNQKEALPKAAFQYGVKMADGRKTRRLPKERNEKAELDREWQKISAIIAKRKSAGEDGGGRSKRAKE